MKKFMPLVVALMCALAFVGNARAQGVRFSVRLDDKFQNEVASGRLIVVLVPQAAGPKAPSPLDGPFWEHDFPAYALDAEKVTPTNAALIDDAVPFRLSVKPSELPPGDYSAAARLVTRRDTSSWRRDPGNYFSAPMKFSVHEPAGEQKDPLIPAIELVLSQKTTAREWPKGDDAPKLVEIRSRLLSEFHGRDVFLRAGVVPPIDFDASRRYAAVYHVPGFGGDHFDAMGAAAQRARLLKEKPEGSELDLARNTFHITLDPESPNGHTLFADSDNNGPCGQALVEELIPAIEAAFPLKPIPNARLLRGHSSGGWSVIWLAMQHPGTFGAAWSTAPDPIDFRRFQMVDIYASPSMFTTTADGKPVPTPAFRRDGKVIMTVERESRNEHLLGQNQTSGQQWASWQAVWGPRVGEKGFENSHPHALFDAISGKIDPAIAQMYRAYDIGDLLRSKPETYAPIFRDRIRLVVGAEDNFYLEQAVKLVQQDLRNLEQAQGSGPGYIKIVPGKDHGSVFATGEVRAFPSEMLQHLRGHDLIVHPANATDKK